LGLWVAMAVAAAVARSRQAALERQAQKEALAAEANALIERAQAAQAWEQKKREELREVLQPGNDKVASKLVEKCPSKLFVEVNEDGLTAVHVAAATCCAACIEIMLRRRDLDLKLALAGDSKGRTPLHHAVLNDGQEAKAVKALLKHSKLEARDCDGLTARQTAQKWGFTEAAAALHVAEESRRRELEAKRKKEEVVEEVEVKCNPQDITFMAGINAINEGRFDDARAITANMDWRFVNQVDTSSNTVLHLAALKGLDDVCRNLLGREDFLSCDSKNKNHATALHLAAGNKHVGCVRAIVEGGRFTAVNARDMLDRTALHLAALRSDAESYEAIASHKECRPGIPDRYGKSAAEYALERGLNVELPIPEPDIEL